MNILETIAANRRKLGLLTPDELTALAAETGSIFLDPFSTMISARVMIGRENVFFPGVTLLLEENGELTIGEGNTVYPGVCFRIGKSNKVKIEDRVTLGDGGVLVRLLEVDANVTIGSSARLMAGVQIIGSFRCGSGAQVLGSIVVKNCDLEAGESFRNPNVDLRGAVLKGYGLAENIVLPRGAALAGQGIFEMSRIQQQRFYHPPDAGAASPGRA